MKVGALAISLCLSLSPLYAYQDVRRNLAGDRVVDIDFEHLKNHNFASKIIRDHQGDQLGADKEQSRVSVKMSEEGIEALRENGVEFEDSTERWINQLQNTLDHPNLFCTDGAEECAGRSMQDFFSTYQDLDALTTRIEQIVDGTDLAIRKTIGNSTENRPIHVVEIGNQTKPLAYFMCNIHAREWLTPMYCAFMIEKLVEDGGHRLLDTFSFAIIPTGNPDGYEFSRTTNNFWRKTRNINQGSDCIGTDPNRNYGDHHCELGTSNNPCSDIFCGIAPFSTPETKAIDDYGSEHEERLIVWNDYHSFGGLWLSPLGFDFGEPPAVDFDRMSACMDAAVEAVQKVNGRRFIAGAAADVLSPAAGASDDWFYFGHNVIYSYTVELRGSEFQPNPSNIDPSNREIFAGMTAQLDCVAEIELEGSIDQPDDDAEEPDEDAEEPEEDAACGISVNGFLISAIVVATSIFQMLQFY